MTTLEQLQALSDDQLIEKVAVEVLGWGTCMRKGTYAGEAWDVTPKKRGGPGSFLKRNWNPLTNWNHTMEVLETVKRRGWEGRLKRSVYPFILTEDRYGGAYSGGAWLASFGVGFGEYEAGPFGDDITCSHYWDRPRTVVAHHDPRRALCLAALLAVSQ